MIMFEIKMWKRMISFSLIVYCVSLCCPMFYASNMFYHYHFNIYTFNVFFFGILFAPLYILFGIGGIVCFELISLVNIIYFYCLTRLRRPKHNPVRLLYLMIISIFLISLFYYVDDPNNFHSHYIDGKAVGYFLWLYSFIILLVAIVYDSIRRRKKVGNIWIV